MGGNNLGVVLESQDRFSEAGDIGHRSIALARRAGDRVRELGWLSGEIIDLVAMGKWDEAMAQAAEVLAAPELPSLEWVAASLPDLMPVLINRGRLEQAREHLQAIRLQDTGNPETRVGYDLGRLRLLRAEGDSAGALAIAQEGLRAPEPSDVSGDLRDGVPHPGRRVERRHRRIQPDLEPSLT